MPPSTICSSKWQDATRYTVWGLTDPKTDGLGPLIRAFQPGFASRVGSGPPTEVILELAATDSKASDNWARVLITCSASPSEGTTSDIALELERIIKDIAQPALSNVVDMGAISSSDLSSVLLASDDDNEEDIRPRFLPDKFATCNISIISLIRTPNDGTTRSRGVKQAEGWSTVKVDKVDLPEMMSRYEADRLLKKATE